MTSEDRQLLLARRGFEMHGIVRSAIHQGLCQGRNRTDSSLAGFRLIRSNNPVIFFLPMLIPDVNRRPNPTFPGSAGGSATMTESKTCCIH